MLIQSSLPPFPPSLPPTGTHIWVLSPEQLRNIRNVMITSARWLCWEIT